MNKVWGKIKEQKRSLMIISIIVIAVVLIAGGILWFIDYKNKEYMVEEVKNFQYYSINQNGKIGVINLRGDIVIEPKYDSIKIPNPEKAVFICELEGKSEVLNEKSETIFTQYDQITAISIKGIVTNLPYEKSVLCYQKDGKYGLIDFNGKVITKPIYDEIESLTNKESELLVKKDNKYGVINSRGATIINPIYDDIVGDGFYTAKDKYKLSGYIVTNKTEEGYRYGYINSRLKKVLETQYTEIYRIIEIEETKDVYLIASKNGQVGVVKNDKVIINYGYQEIEYDEYNKLFRLERNSKYGVADITGKQIVAVEYDDIDFNAMYISAVKDDQEMLFDTTGNEVKDSNYTSILKTENGKYCISVDKNGLYGIITTDNKVLVENKYHYIEYLFDEYFIAAKQEGDLGIINARDSIIVDFKYDVLQKIQGSTVVEAKILSENKTELYSKAIEKVVTMTNATVYTYDNYIQMYSDKEVKYFNLEGKEISNIEIFKNNTLFAKKQDDKWGFVDKTGNFVVKAEYERVTEFNEYGFAGIKQNDKWGVIDQGGNIILEPTYSFQESAADPEFIGQYYKVYYGYGESYYTNLINE